MVRIDGLLHQVLRIAADHADRRQSFQNKTVLAADRQRDIHLPDIVEIEAAIEEADQRPDRTGRVVVLCL